MFFAIFAFLLASTPQAERRLLTQTTEIRALENDHAVSNGPPFRLQGQIVAKAFPGFLFNDTTGGIVISPSTNQTQWSVGDIVEIDGNTRVINLGVIFATAQTLRVLRHEDPPAPKTVQAGDILNGTVNYQPVRLNGVIYDASCDEIDPRWTWFILISNGEKIAVALNETLKFPQTRDKYVGCSVEITGVCIPGNNGGRLFLGSRLEIPSLDSIRILDTLPLDPFDVDEFKPNKNSPHLTGSRFDARKKVSGQVLAAWGSQSFLLKAGSYLTIRVKLRSQQQLPPHGTHVTVSGFVIRDSFFVTFTDALCRRNKPDERPVDRHPPLINAKNLFRDESGMPHIRMRYDGQLIRLKGTVRAYSNINASDQHMLLEADSQDIWIEIGKLTTPPIGSVIDISGICMMTAEHDASGFDRIRTISLIPRSQKDIRVVSTPSWWTPVRSLLTIGALLLLMSVILVWTTLLKKLAERRGRDLAKSQVASATNALKVYERTRLAVELHDSLSQTLTGVSFEVNTAGDLIGTDESKVRKHLSIAAKALDACRIELRNCLWDLRSQALEEDDMNEAIRLTLGQDIGGSQTTIRFNVARQLFTDNTAHAILRIIRELVTNAVRHGHATHIRVAGTIDGGQVLFSVRDDGCGFDPDNAPGPREGHFGLDGIRERIERIDGTFSINSERGQGTTAVVTIPLPQTQTIQKEER